MSKIDKKINKAVAVKEKYEADLLAKEGVTAVGVGMRNRGGSFTDEVVIVVTVTRKYARAELDTGDLLPAKLEGVPVDVQEGGHIKTG